MHVWYLIRLWGKIKAVQWNSYYGDIINNMPAVGPFWTHTEAQRVLEFWAK